MPDDHWPTPITPLLVASSAVDFAEIRVDGADVIWSECRPAAPGRIQLVRGTSDGVVSYFRRKSRG